MYLKVLVIGDIVGSSGVRAIYIGLKQLKNRLKADLVVANGENATDGLGLSIGDAKTIFGCGVDVITSGNHIWQKREIWKELEENDYILRPENYPVGVSGKGQCVVSVRDIPVGILNLEGREHLSNLRCPFKVAKDVAAKLAARTKNIIVDFHAESTEEKEALGLYLDGVVSAVVGTHTHVQTADEKILPMGTAYISDIGMTGPEKSVIGIQIEDSVHRSRTNMPIKMAVSDNPAWINGVLVTIDSDSGRAVSLERIVEPPSV